MMDQAVANFFAELASVADLKTLERWQREKFIADATKAGILHPHAAGREWRSIASVHPWAHEIINSLVDTGRADVRQFMKAMLRPAQWRIDPKTGTVISLYAGDSALKEPWVHFVKVVLYSAPCPFKRCALCRSIFVPRSKKQKKYCTKECSNKAVSLKPERKKYMKDYMADKRELEKRSRSRRQQKRA